MLTTPSQQTPPSAVFHRTASKPDLVLKSSCGDLQSRLKVRKVLGVGDATGATCSSKISQILGHPDNFIFQLPPRLTTWLLLVTTLFCSFTLMGLLWPSHLRLILPGSLESTVHLAASYAFFATMLGLTLRSGDKTSLQLVLFSLALYHALSLLIACWILRTNDGKLKSTTSILVHFLCLIINVHFYRSINRSMSPIARHNKLKTYFNSMVSFPTQPTVDFYTDPESSSKET